MKMEGINTLSIHSYLRALNCLAHFVKLAFCVICLKKYFEKTFRFDFVMILVGMYTKCLEIFCLENV